MALVLIAGGLIAFLLVRRSHRRRAWETELADAQAEIGWFARDLVPALRGSGDLAGVKGGWAVATPRVQSLEDRLTRLGTTAPSPEAAARAESLRDAVRGAHVQMDALAAREDTALWRQDLDEVQTPLLAVLLPDQSETQPPA